VNTEETSSSKPSTPPTGGQINFPDATPAPDLKPGNKFSDIPGRLADFIGTGPHAQSNIVWSVIWLSFGTGFVLSLIAALHLFCDPDYDFVEKCKGIWSIFVPLITLAIGYLFGKRADD